MTDQENSETSDAIETKDTMGIKWILLFAIILIALFLRLYNLEYMEFKGDEAIYSFKASRMVDDGVIPLTSGVSSVGIHEPPIFVYLLSVPFSISKDPVLAAEYIAVLNVLAILICFFLVKDLFNKNAGLIAVAFYAVSPWAVSFSRKIWFPEFLLLFIMLFIYFAYRFVTKEKKSSLVYVLISLGFICQLHFAAFYFIPVFLVIAVRYRQKLCKKSLAVGVALFLLMVTPYTIHLFKNNFADIENAKNLSSKESRFNKEAFSTILKLSTTNGFEASFGKDYDRFEKNVFKLNFLDAVQMLALSCAFIYFIVTYNSSFFILSVWLLFGVLSLAFAKVNLVDHYFIHILPLIFILLGNMFYRLLKSDSSAVKYAASAYILILLSYQFYFSFNLISFPKDKQCINGDYGPPFSYRVADIKKAMREGKKDINAIHSYCKCVKCDRTATMYIVRYLN